MAAYKPTRTVHALPTPSPAACSGRVSAIRSHEMRDIRPMPYNPDTHIPTEIHIIFLSSVSLSVSILYVSVRCNDSVLCTVDCLLAMKVELNWIILDSQ